MLIKQQKIENISLLLTKPLFFNKKKYIVNLHIEEYSVFYTFDYFIQCM